MYYHGCHRKKTLVDWEVEACFIGGCLVHPSTSNISRVVYQLRHGKLDDPKILVCHTCDNRQCILDAHHFIGSCKDNLRDAAAKGRMNQSRVGKPLSIEVKAKISKSHTGMLATAEAKAKMSASRKGVPHSEEHRKNLAASQIGRKHSQESKAKMSASHKVSWVAGVYDNVHPKKGK